MLTNRQIDKVNSFLKDRTFRYNENINYTINEPSDFDFKFQIIGFKKMINVGEYYDYIVVDVDILNFRDSISKIIFGKTLGDETSGMFKDNWYFKQKLTNEIKRIILMIDPEQNRVIINNIRVINNEQKEPLKESKMSKLPVRTITKDILQILKTKQDGEFYLPDNDDGIGYSFTNFPIELNVELQIDKNYDIDGFKMNADYSEDDEVIELLIVYNPDNLRESLYDIVGELNEVLTHEIEHALQNYRGEFTNKVVDSESSLEYYTQPHEIGAQVAGFKRLSKLRKQPFEKVVRNWFDTHKDIHNLDGNEVEIVIDKLINYKK